MAFIHSDYQYEPPILEAASLSIKSHSLLNRKKYFFILRKTAAQIFFILKREAATLKFTDSSNFRED